MGAAILLQALPREPRFRAVVADCPFASFSQIAQDRLSQVAGLPTAVFWPTVTLGVFYGRLRYGVDLRQASPMATVRETSTPILLIHGTADTNIPIRHSRELHSANPRATRLWEVPGAGHVASLEVEPDRYKRTVTEWFRDHP